MPPLESIRFPDGLLVLRSRLLHDAGFVHGFSTRLGGSDDDFDLTRAAAHDRDATADADALRDRLARLIDAGHPGGHGGTPRTIDARQVHGADVLVDHGSASCDDHEVDGLVSDRTDAVVLVRTADCVPILLADRRTGRVAAVHAGWRGLVADVVRATVDAMRAHGSAREDLVAAIGPAIGVDRYEVGDEVATAFRANGLGEAIRARSPRPHADLHRAARLRLASCGLDDARIDGAPCCTADDPERFFSHRRDRGRTGRHVAFVRPRSPANA